MSLKKYNRITFKYFIKNDLDLINEVILYIYDKEKNMELELSKILNEEKITFEKSENTITDDEREQAITKLRKLGYI